MIYQSTNQENQSFLPDNPKKGSAFLPFTFCLVSFFLLILSGCDDSFQPLQENDRYFFSIYGYLDASADTQWVRVGPLREQRDMLPEKPKMQVTLNHLRSDHTIVMNDSLLQISGDNLLNVWTTNDIKAGHTYRLQAKRPDGKTSQVTVTLPEELPTPRLREENRLIGQGPAYTVFIDGMNPLADVQSRWFVRLKAPGIDQKKMFYFSYKNEAEKDHLGEYKVTMDPDWEREQLLSQSIIPHPPDGEIQVLHRQVFVAIAGPEWKDDIDSLDDLVYALPESLTNVEDGLGYMVGVVSKSIPFKSCYNDQRQLIACPEEKPFW